LYLSENKERLVPLTA